jgi:hypothetical protein
MYVVGAVGEALTQAPVKLFKEPLSGVQVTVQGEPAVKAALSQH